MLSAQAMLHATLSIYFNLLKFRIRFQTNTSVCVTFNACRVMMTPQADREMAPQSICSTVFFVQLSRRDFNPTFVNNLP